MKKENIRQASKIEGLHTNEDIKRTQDELIKILENDLNHSLFKNNIGWIGYKNLNISIKNINIFRI